MEQMPSLLSVRSLLLLLFVLLMVFCATSKALALVSLEAGVSAIRKVQAASAPTRMINNSTSTASIAKPGCRDRCGNVSIPYPFGMDSGNCYLSTGFKIYCDSSYNPPVAFLMSGHADRLYEILELTQDYVRINILAPAICDLDNTTSITSKLVDPLTNSTAPNFFGTPFTISNTLNKFTVLGCNIFGVISPLQEYKVDDIILAEDDTSVPVILDWAITDGFLTCQQAQSNLSQYACGRNTDCLESYNSPGYRCKCLKGYGGNPYLPGGCQDIDECEELNKCGKGVNCLNTPGSYNCVCSPGKLLVTNELGLQCMPNKRNLLIVMGVPLGIGVSVIVLVLLGISYWLYNGFQKRKQDKLKQNHFARNGGLLLKQKVHSSDGRVEKAAKIFETEELEKATNNFNPSRIIGKGGHGTVYKGMLPGGEIVAIKKSRLVDETQVDQFINEVVILSQINHRHIVKLLGCCLETQVPLLVYEFISNGTLAYHLRVEEGDNASLSWKDRVRIASEIAGALAYLHLDASAPIFHRDIKSDNILLDENYKAKVSDFGISRSIPVDKTHLTTLVKGTFGYLDPEYFHSSQFTDKSDVYSFGMVLAELLTGERAISQIRHEEEESLAFYLINSMKESRLFGILDSRVRNEAVEDDVMVVAELAKRCLKYVGKKRPDMKEVALSLSWLHEKLSRDGILKLQETEANSDNGSVLIYPFLD
ncbi:wall-associated receptor kinase-like 9 isoform X3 [Papaver somniferum]|uniref:wall-associated receptor kinase-like 9 isoform X3 n=1 Tax=Papaver somniferum TaxID=3469 RepID=UPI000E700D7B|nr:wall-associated receptor kinase-like 9 isoform X3 [Papaver somniferum]